MQERFGLRPRYIRDADVQRALQALAERTGITDIVEVCRLLEDRCRPAALDEMVSVLTVGETYFFRDPAQYEIIADQILPPLVRGSTERPLQVLSAGCSTGEEAWSLAMVTEQVQRRESTRRPLCVTGVDIDRRALRVATEGVYGAWSFRGVDASTIERNFLRRGAQLQVAPRFREQVRFVHANLSGPASSIPDPDGGFDLVICRNALMYLDEHTARRVVARLHELLSDQGWLVVAASETMLPVYDGFGPVAAPDATVFRKLPAAATTQAPPERPIAVVGATTAAAALVVSAPAVAPSEPRRGSDIAVEPSVEPEWQHWYEQAMGLRESGDLAGAADALRRAIYLDPFFAPAHVFLAGVLALRGNHHRARKELEVAHALLADRPSEEQLLVDDHEVTVERLLDLVAAQRQILDEVAS